MAHSLFARKPVAMLLQEVQGDDRLRRVLGPWQLTSLGIGAVIGAGIFVSTGAVARQTAGPALMLSYAVAGLACVFAALCYAEFASMVPAAGSAYTYAYATLGELFAWIIGWDLTLEYAVSSATVATGWSGYFQSLLGAFGLRLPPALSGPAVDIGVVAVLTGMVRYDQLDVAAPVADAFGRVGLRWAQVILALAGVAGITSVMLVTMLSQARVLLAIARDGLLPRSFFAAVHPRFRTPWKSTIVTGLFVGVLAAFLPITVLLTLVNMGTLFAFVVVCAAVLVMRRTAPDVHRPFRAPFVPFVPLMGIASCLLLMFSLPPENWLRLFVWAAIGLAIYFGYGRSRSVLAQAAPGRARQRPRAVLDGHPPAG